MTSLPTRLAHGLLAGALGWWAMDRTLQALYDRQSRQHKEEEARARGYVPALERLGVRLAGAAGRTLTPKERERGGTLLQWTVGLGGGVLYAALRPHLPGRGPTQGLAYGLAFSLGVDQGLTPLLGLAPGPTAFPWQTHARGLVGHLVFGLVAERVLHRLED